MLLKFNILNTNLATRRRNSAVLFFFFHLIHLIAIHTPEETLLRKKVFVRKSLCPYLFKNGWRILQYKSEIAESLPRMREHRSYLHILNWPKKGGGLPFEDKWDKSTSRSVLMHGGKQKMGICLGYFLPLWITFNYCRMSPLRHERKLHHSCVLCWCQCFLTAPYFLLALR